jgi:hypothetical protein
MMTQQRVKIYMSMKKRNSYLRAWVTHSPNGAKVRQQDPDIEQQDEPMDAEARTLLADPKDTQRYSEVVKKNQKEPKKPMQKNQKEPRNR